MKKIAIVYDWFDSWGGVERILLLLHKLYPDAQFYSSYVNYQKAPWAKKLPITTSFIQKLPPFIKNNRILSMPFYPPAFEAFDFKGYNIVISITSSYAKGIITRPETKHICYLLTPTRFLWLEEDTHKRAGLLKFASAPYLNYLKTWDKIAASRPDEYITISKTVQKRLKDIYKKESTVIYPPFDINHWKDIKPVSPEYSILNTKYYLVVSRLEPYKKVDLVVRAFNNEPHKKLIIVGVGSQLKTLQKMACSNITFTGLITDAELARYYSKAQALIMMQNEDFGYTSLEAQFFCCPVIAYNKGGAKETILNGKTGILFDTQTIASLIETLEKYEKVAYTFKRNMKKYIKNHLETFSQSYFITAFQERIKTLL